MKIQGLAIIFIIIILPISIVIGEYARTQIETFRLEQLYDTWLITATDDALKAFQINAFNDVTSKLPDSKINSIEASANAFYNSMESSFRLNGYSKEELQMYVPALVYTMYDGYYIYSPYTNVAKITEKENGDTGNDIDSEYTEKELTIDLNSSEKSYGFKPYVYYSSRYKVGTNSDFVINYSLDNYITIQGIIDGDYVYKSGHLLTIAGSSTDNGVYVNGEQVYYNGVQILQESNLEDWLYERDADGNVVSETGKAYKYIKENGTKYYMNEDYNYIFYWYGGDITIIRDEATYNSYKAKIENNTSAIQYYKDAYNFTKWVNNNNVLKNLKTSNAEAQVKNKGDEKIFENDQIESPSSNFNLHRKEVIRASIESNLSVAIANFNSYTNSGANFQMPELKETDWELLQNEISIISFLQGLNIGGKRYNGYTVVTNGKTEEVVKEESIYITTTDGYYHKINDKHFQKNESGNYEYDEGMLGSGVLKSDFEIRKDATVGLSYIYKKQLGCYTSIVSQENVDNTYDSIYEYLLNTDLTTRVKQIYYISLGRERYGTYKVEHSLINSSLITD